MANETLKGCKVAILVTDGFEQVELTEPRKALDQAGAETRIVSPKAPGLSSRRVLRAAASSLPGHRLRPISPTPAPSGWIKRRWSTAIW